MSKKKKITESLMPMTVKELKEMLSQCPDESRIIAKVVTYGKDETTGWVAGRIVPSIFKENTIEVYVDLRGID